MGTNDLHSRCGIWYGAKNHQKNEGLTKPSDSKWNLRYNPEETAVNMRYTCETSWFLTLASRFLNLNRFWLWYVLVPSQLIVNRFWMVLVCFGPFLPWVPYDHLWITGSSTATGHPGAAGMPGTIQTVKQPHRSLPAFSWKRRQCGHRTSCWTCVLNQIRNLHGYTYTITHTY